ncbi:MAG: DUF3046 domain-containing protein [Geodermatophilaceae bacterium]
MTEFWEQMKGQFGPGYAESVARDHVSARLAGRTAAQAIEDCEPYKKIWLALCGDFDLPARVR